MRVEDALARGTPKVLVEAVAALEEESERIDAVFDVAGHLCEYPKVKVGTRTTPVLRRILDELLEEKD